MGIEQIDNIIGANNESLKNNYKIDNTEYLEDFLVESKEHLESIERSLLSYENSRDDMTILNSIFRDFHTIKGLSGFVSQGLIQRIAHHTESFLDKCRKGEERVTDLIITDIFNSSDYIKRICDNLELNSDKAFQNEITNFLDNFGQKINSSFITDININKHIQESIKTSPENQEHFKIDTYVQEPLRTEPKAQSLLKEVDNLHEPLETQPKAQRLIKNVGDVQKPSDTDTDLQRHFKTDGNKCEHLKPDPIEIGNVVDNIIENSNIKTNAIFYDRKKLKAEPANVRIPIKKVDNLVELVGELLTSYSQFEEEILLNNASTKSIAMLKKLSSHTKDIQNISISMRLVSFKSLFQRLERIGRDTINELNKNAQINFTGEETEIDRSIVEMLLEPLLHLIKNGVYHGIESRQERIVNNKNPIGNICVRAHNRKGFVYIEVSDDGRGIDTEKILQTTIDKNLVDPFIDYSENEILNFIFLPGFSTIEKADKISGRGVGLDVVKTQISKIGGKVEIINTPGQGCCFSMKLPINLSVLNGTIVQIALSQFIIPTSSINGIFKPRDEDFVSVKGATSFVKFKEKVIPIVDVQNHLLIESNDKYNSTFIVLEANHGFYAFPVDKIIEKRDVIVKSLGSDFEKLDYAFGASILGNGKISIILDIEKMLSGRGNEL